MLDAWNLRWTTFAQSLRVFQGIGILFVAGGLVIRFLARKALGKHYSVYVATSQSHHLVTEGIFSLVRHPAYLGLIGLFIGIPLCEGSWGGIILALLGGIPSILYRIHLEEKSLREWFGEAYQQYKTRTYRLIPYIW